MFIAHLPSGYIASKLLFPRVAVQDAAFKPFLFAGALGAIAPDLDLIYFYLADHRMHPHHIYWPHFPIIWFSLLLISLAWFYTSRTKNLAASAINFSLNGLIHLILDSVVGGIWWFAPFIDKPFRVFTVPAVYKPWWLNFPLHWSFAFEIAIVVWAICLWRQNTKLHAQYF